MRNTLEDITTCDECCEKLYYDSISADRIIEATDKRGCILSTYCTECAAKCDECKDVFLKSEMEQDGKTTFFCKPCYFADEEPTAPAQFTVSGAQFFALGVTPVCFGVSLGMYISSQIIGVWVTEVVGR